MIVPVYYPNPFLELDFELEEVLIALARYMDYAVPYLYITK